MTDTPPPFASSEVEKHSAGERVSTSLDTNGAGMIEAGGRWRTLGLAIALLIFIADQLSKWIVTYPLGLQNKGVIDLLPFFDLRWVENRGVSGGFLTAQGDLARWGLVAMTAAIATGVLVWLWREKNKWDAVALSFVLGGALGNIVDRVRYGFVVDFADLHIGEFRPFLVFNVADAAITIGVVLLIARAVLVRDKTA